VLNTEKEEKIYNIWNKVLINKNPQFKDGQGSFYDLYYHYDIRISYQVIKTINFIESMSLEHKAFAFSYLILLAYMNENMISIKLSKSEYKEMLGYSPINKEVDKIIKKNGILYEKRLILTQGFKPKRNEGEYKLVNLNPPRTFVHNVRKSFYISNIIELRKMVTEHYELGLVGFYIYNFILQSHNINYHDFTNNNSTLYEKMMITNGYIATGIGASENTVIKYLNLLVKYNYLTKFKTDVKVDDSEWFYKPVNAYGIKRRRSGYIEASNTTSKTIAEMIQEQRIKSEK
jgi:hypothetical protein